MCLRWKTFVAHVWMHLAFKVFDDESCCAANWIFRSRPAVMIQTCGGFVFVFLLFALNASSLKGASLGTRAEPKPLAPVPHSDNLDGAEPLGDQSAAPLLKLFPMRPIKWKGKKTSRNCTRTKHLCYFIREPSQCNFVRLISNFEPDIFTKFGSVLGIMVYLPHPRLGLTIISSHCLPPDH